MCGTECTHCYTGTTCAKLDGHCYGHACADGLTGYNCNVSCPDGCKKCERYNPMHCGLCKAGWYGYNWSVASYTCTQMCSSTCLNGKCHLVNGSCIVGCEVGWWGTKCEHDCQNCIHLSCEQHTGYCAKKYDQSVSTNKTDQGSSEAVSSSRDYIIAGSVACVVLVLVSILCFLGYRSNNRLIVSIHNSVDALMSRLNRNPERRVGNDELKDEYDHDTEGTSGPYESLSDNRGHQVYDTVL
ncbi:scavenger receptor class F member 1-like isoform X2 [Mya arenaria]|nr:scavenger receptor class F member 1-like isoform X2 [Mya arenaria]